MAKKINSRNLLGSVSKLSATDLTAKVRAIASESLQTVGRIGVINEVNVFLLSLLEQGIIIDTKTIFFAKNIIDSGFGLSDTVSKNIAKGTFAEIIALNEVLTFAFVKNLQDTAATQDQIDFAVNKAATDTAAAADEFDILFTKNLIEIVSATDTITQKDVGKGTSDTASGADLITQKDVGKVASPDTTNNSDISVTKFVSKGGLADTSRGTDTSTREANKRINSETASASDTRPTVFTSKVRTDTARGTDTSVREAGKGLSDTGRATDTTTKEPGKNLTETARGTDTSVREPGKNLTETARGTDTSVREPGKGLSDTARGTDSITRKDVVKLIQDTITIIDDTTGEGPTVFFNSGNADSNSLTDQLSRIVDYIRTVTDTSRGTDTTTKEPGKGLSDTARGTDTTSKAVEKAGLTDTARGTDTSVREPGKGASDTARGTDTSVREVVKGLSDTGRGTDTISSKYFEKVLGNVYWNQDQSNLLDEYLNIPFDITQTFDQFFAIGATDPNIARATDTITQKDVGKGNIDTARGTDTSVKEPNPVLGAARSTIVQTNPTTGYYYGGFDTNSFYSSEIDGIIYATDTATNPSASTGGAGVYFPGTVTSETLGYIRSGQVNGGTYLSGIYTFNLSNQTVSIIVDNFGNPRKVAGSASNTALGKGFLFGGENSGTIYQFVEKINFSNNTQTSGLNNIQYQVAFAGVVQSPFKAFIGGGYVPGFTYLNTVTGYVMSSETATAVSATLATTRGFISGSSAQDRGFYVGGATGASVFDEIDGLLYSNESSLNYSAALSTPRWGSAAVSTATDGYHAGGSTSTAGVPSVNTISKLNFNLQSINNLSATLATARQGLAAIGTPIFNGITTSASTARGTDTIARETGKVATDTARGTDTSVREPNKRPADTARGTDTSVREPNKRPSDTARGTDTTSKEPGKGASDTARGTDSVARVADYVRQPTDTGRGTDSVVRTADYVRQPADTGRGTDVSTRQYFLQAGGDQRPVLTDFTGIDYNQDLGLLQTYRTKELFNNYQIDWAAFSAGLLQAAVSAEPGNTLFNLTTIGSRKLGDLTNDGSVTSADALMAQKIASNQYTPADLQIGLLAPTAEAYNWVMNYVLPYMATNIGSYSSYLTTNGSEYAPARKADTATINETFVKLQGKNPADTARGTDSVVRTATYVRQTADTGRGTDAVAKAITTSAGGESNYVDLDVAGIGDIPSEITQFFNRKNYQSVQYTGASTQTYNFAPNTSGPTGPTNLSSVTWSSSETLSPTVTNGYVSFFVSSTRYYTFNITGAAGGVYTAGPPTTAAAPTINGFKRAPGARVVGKVLLTQGQTVTMVIGQGGGDEPSFNNPGGGGGTFITLGTYADVVAGTDTLLFAAGGGGGAGLPGTTDNYSAGIGQATTSGGSADAVGGTNGNGGVSQPTNNSTSGGGYLSNAGGSTVSNFGGTPQDGATNGFRQGSVGSRNSGTAVGYGGFGGGGSGSAQTSPDNDKGGGGGYSGGGYAFDANVYGGGGGSYATISATDVAITAGGGTTYNGSVNVTVESIVLSPTPNTYVRSDRIGAGDSKSIAYSKVASGEARTKQYEFTPINYTQDFLDLITPDPYTFVAPVTPAALISAYFAGGNSSSNIASNQISKLLATTDSLTATAIVLQNAKADHRGSASSTKGYYFAGRSVSTIVSGTDAITFSSETRSNPASSLNPYIQYGAASNSTIAYQAAGCDATFATTFNEISKYTFATETAASASGTLSPTRLIAGTNSSTAAYFNGLIYGTSLQKILFATDTSATLSAILQSSRSNSSTVSSPTTGYYIGGSSSTEIDGIQFATDTGINPAAVASLNEQDSQGVSGSTAGYMPGGWNGGTASFAVKKFTFSTETMGQLAGSLASALYSIASTGYTV